MKTGIVPCFCTGHQKNLKKLIWRKTMIGWHRLLSRLTNVRILREHFLSQLNVNLTICEGLVKVKVKECV